MTAREEIAEFIQLVVSNLGHPVGMGVSLPAEIAERLADECLAIAAKHQYGEQ
jgi:hypothetical protein